MPKDFIDTKGSGFKNPLDDEKKAADVANSIYTDKDREYLQFIQGRLERAKEMRDQKYPEFNGLTYLEYYQQNERIANTTHLGQKKNQDDVIISAGTVEQKLDAVLASINNLNLTTEVFAFDNENNRVVSISQALEDIIHDTEILDRADGAGDKEKKPKRQRQLLKQGTVFVQEEWLKKWETKKVLNKKYNGQFKDFSADDGWSEKLELVFEGPTRNVLYGPNVYLGDITKFNNDDQTCIFTLVTENYEVAKSKYQKFDNWEYVKKGKASFSNVADESKTIFDNKWRLSSITDEQVEIITYQDQMRDEFQIIINGVLMLPIGFPLSAVSPGGRFNIAKQVYRIINDEFAYGSSFVASGSVKEVSAIIDEMLRLFVLKTRKSFTPSYVNTSGRVIDAKVLRAGRISMGFTADQLQAIGQEVQGVTQGEVLVYKEMTDLINKNTVSDQFTGQRSSGSQTATEVLELRKQAQLSLGLAILSCTLLETKLGYLRLWNILENWFNPIDTKVVTVNDIRKIVSKFRKTNRETNIQGEGFGERSVITSDDKLPDSKTIRAIELSEEKEKGFPVRKIFINRSGLKSARLILYIVVNPKEQEGSTINKLQFREMLNDVLALVQIGSVPSKEALEEQFSRIHSMSRSKLFEKTQQQGATNLAGNQGGGEARGRPNLEGVPQPPAGV